MKKKIWLGVILSLNITAAMAAQVDVSGAWVRGTVPGQKSTGVFMKLKAHEPTTLVSVSTPVAGFSEIHEMKMEGRLMKMRELKKGLPLRAMRTVKLKPGGYHIMIMDLKEQLKNGDTVPLTLRFEDARHVVTDQQVNVPVRDLVSGAPAGYRKSVVRQHDK
ncbi:copper chaperone PCu(A)C [Candidatus Pandoraea novymonadis]|uniref:Copper chaperone PCu(A)C n=1 Tax=Candidatus Pandoraea novymonadis TaxID=1808959 RepID=A0ABX5FD23_9BURK|nr:copper chaperone PCu(A)C [Candidatus Pandoraea novymonadis]PSB91631.1 hypothetical protein BZL35_00848 [Candidatus Pandoraea novymonadis]